MCIREEHIGIYLFTVRMETVSTMFFYFDAWYQWYQFILYNKELT